MTTFGFFFGFLTISLSLDVLGCIVLMLFMVARFIKGNTGKDYRNYHQINAIRHNYDTRNEDANWDLFKN